MYFVLGLRTDCSGPEANQRKCGWDEVIMRLRLGLFGLSYLLFRIGKQETGNYSCCLVPEIAQEVLMVLYKLCAYCVLTMLLPCHCM